MAWNGYLTYGGNEIINVARTEAYAKADGSHWLRPLFKIPELAFILGDRTYTSPLADLDCPWVDVDDADSYGFYGFYPTNIAGLEDSSRTSSPIEYTSDGGSPGLLRHGTRAVVISGVLMGQDDAAVDYGMRWLRNALLGDCYGGCTGSELSYFYAEPAYDSSAQLSCADEYLRTMRKALVNNGPTVMTKHQLSDGAAVWEVQFTVVVGDPFEYGPPILIVDNMFASNASNKVGGWLEAGLRVVPEVHCAQPVYTPVTDPSCPNLILPPATPQIPLSCFSPPKNWRRRAFQIPAAVVPAWTEMVPIITITVTSTDLHNLRLRFYADPNETFDIDSDPCAYCYDILVTYAPANSVIVIDGRDETVLATTGTQTRRADGLVLQSNGQPLAWPALSCGIGYQVACDIPQTPAGHYTFDLSLAPRNR